MSAERHSDAVEYRPSLARTLVYLVGFATAAGGGIWCARLPNASPLDRLVGLLAAGTFGGMALVVLFATLRFRAVLRLDAQGVRMVDRFGRLRLDVPWSAVADAYEADHGRDPVVILVASDTPSNLGREHAPPVGLTGPGGESLGYGYVVNPSIVDVRAPDLIGEVQRRLHDRLGGWDPTSGG